MITRSIRLSSITRWLNRLQPSEEAVLVITSLLVGIGTGLGAVAFNLLIQWVSTASFEWAPQALPWLGPWAILIIPTLGGLAAGPLIYFFAREAKGHGVPEVMQAIALRGGRIRPIVAVVKAVASSLTIGTGGSVGREGPIVQIGAALGSTLGQTLRLSDERIRNLVACGAAGGIAATFNAPIAGMIFALEVILGELSVGHVGTIVISAVTANVLTRAILGGAYAFPIPQPYAIQSIWEFAFYAVLGVLSALVAVLFVKSLYKSEDTFEAQKRIPEWLQPAIGGLMLGALALIYPLIFPSLGYDAIPQVFGGGYAPISAALSGQVVIGAAVALIFLKMAATNLTLGSGGSGGIFAPSLFMGAMLGAAVGVLVNLLFPGIAAPPGAYALVGMGAVFAGSAHAPITALIMLFELTGDYRIILPLMLTVVIAMIISRRLLNNESIYTLKLTRRGIRLQQGRDVEVMEGILVDEVMQTKMAPIRETEPVSGATDMMLRTHRHGLPVVDTSGDLVGIISIRDIEAFHNDGNLPNRPVGDVCTRDLLTAYPDETLSAVMQRMSIRDVGRVPVVSRDNPRKLMGMLRRADMIRAYDLALTRRATLRHRAHQVQLGAFSGVKVREITIRKGAPCAGKHISEVSWPRDCVLATLRRGRQVLIPHGDTIIEPGDVLVAVVDGQAGEDLRKLCAA